MSKKSDAFEKEIVTAVEKLIGQKLPKKLPNWMLKEGILPDSTIESVDGIGSKDRKNKTDVLIKLDKGEHIKISAKLLNADYFGNWYGHKRFLDEFGEDAFKRMTTAATKWANNWKKHATAPFVGVSICFGKRSGNTGQNFTDIFTPQDILTIAKGYGTGNHVANCMYISNHSATSMEDLIKSLTEISIETINKATENFKIAYRPINPLTEGSNRGKNVYTQFKPFQKLPKATLITTAKELFTLGAFIPVTPNSLNHNHILNELDQTYNIVIPRKNT